MSPGAVCFLCNSGSGGLSFGDEALAVCPEEFHQLVDLALEFAAFVGVADSHTARAHLDDLVCADNVGAIFNGILCRGERFVLNELKAAAVEDEGVSGDSGGVVVGASKTSVDNHQTASGFNGILAIADFDGHVSVDDVAMVALGSEFVEYFVADFAVVAQCVVLAFRLAMGLFVLDKIAFKRRHL